MKKLLKISTVLALAIGLVGCGSGKLVGTWKVGSILGVELGGLTFEKDNGVSGKVLGQSFSTGCSYKTKGSTLTFTCPTSNGSTSSSYTFSVDGDTLSLSDINNPDLKVELKRSNNN